MCCILVSICQSTRMKGSLGGVLTGSVPYRFRGLDTIGIIVFLFNIVLYLIIWTLLLTRFYLYPYTFKASLLHPTESLFVPASVVSFGTILINISQYGPDHTGYWLARAVGILFWIDVILAVIFSAGIYLLLYVHSFCWHRCAWSGPKTNRTGGPRKRSPYPK